MLRIFLSTLSGWCHLYMCRLLLTIVLRTQSNVYFCCFVSQMYTIYIVMLNIYITLHNQCYGVFYTISGRCHLYMCRLLSTSLLQTSCINFPTGVSLYIKMTMPFIYVSLTFYNCSTDFLYLYSYAGFFIH